MSPTSQSDYLNRLRLNLRLGFVRAFLSSIMFFVPIWYEFETWFATGAALATIYSVSHLLTVVLELPSGALADLLGRRKTMVLGSLIWVIGYFLIAQQTGAWMLWLGYLINGIGTALFSGSDVALYYDSLKELNREQEFAQYQALKSLIFRIGLVLGTFFGARVYAVNPRLPYLIYSFLMLISTIVTYFYKEPQIDSEQFTLSNYIWQTKQGIKQLTKSTYIRDFSLYYLGVGAVTWYYIYFLSQPLAIDFGLDAQERSVVFAGIFLVMALINYALSSRPNLKRETVYTMFWLMLLIGFLPAAFVGKYIGIVLLFILQLAAALRWTLLDQYANLEFDSRYRATTVSTLNMGVSLLFAILSLSLSWMVDKYSAAVLASVIGLIVLLIVTPTWLTLIRKHNGVRTTQ